MATTTGTVQYNLRITETMRTRLKESAKENERTLNAEIVSRLEKSYESNADLLLEAIADLKAEIQALKNPLTR